MATLPTADGPRDSGPAVGSDFHHALIPTATVAAVAAVLFGAAIVVAQEPGALRVSLNPASVQRYAANVLLAIPHLQSSFVMRALGREIPATETHLEAESPAEPAVAATSASRTTPRPRPSPTPGLPTVLASDLSIAIAADRTTVRPAEDIVYSVIVSNVGRKDFRGELRWSAHTPARTTFRSFEPPPCGQAGVDPNPSRPCVDLQVPVPSGGDDVHNPSQTIREVSIPAGHRVIYAYRVTVDPSTPAGTRLRNHAHLELPGTETTDVITVTVE